MREVNKEEFERFLADYPCHLDSDIYRCVYPETVYFYIPDSKVKPGDWPEIQARISLDPRGYRYFIEETKNG